MRHSGLILALASFALLGCTKGERREPDSTDPADLQLTQALREELIAEPRLSFVSRELGISTRGHRVALRGTVTRDEHELILARAQAVAGPDRVDDHLEVK